MIDILGTEEKCLCCNCKHIELNVWRLRYEMQISALQRQLSVAQDTIAASVKINEMLSSYIERLEALNKKIVEAEEVFRNVHCEE